MPRFLVKFTERKKTGKIESVNIKKGVRLTKKNLRILKKKFPGYKLVRGKTRRLAENKLIPKKF